MAGREQSEQYLSILEMEYKKLWEYYEKMLDIRLSLFELYFKVLALPGVAIAAFVAVYGDSVPVSSSVFAFLLMAVGFAGYCFYLTYTAETANSKYYLENIDAIRERIQQLLPALSGELNLHERRGRRFDDDQTDRNRLTLDIAFWRSGALAIINSAVAAVGFSLLWAVQDLATIGIPVVFCLLVHFVTYKNLLSAYYVRESTVPPAPRA